MIIYVFKSFSAVQMYDLPYNHLQSPLRCATLRYIHSYGTVKLSYNKVPWVAEIHVRRNIPQNQEKAHKFKIVDSPLCAFCNTENESLEHLLFFLQSKRGVLERGIVVVGHP